MQQRQLTIPLTVAACLVVILLTCCHKKDILPPSTDESTRTSESRSLLVWDEEEEKAIVQSIREKLQPRELMFEEDEKTLKPQQFLHLHHMKTGGTSVDHLLKCARTRLEDDLDYTVPYYNIHECARGAFKRCVANETDPCRQPMVDASMMSFCSALKHLDPFGWTEDFGSFTVLRHPVERVWSMYRFETRMCYKCKNLTEIYDMIDSNETIGLDRLCLAQMQNHETANLLSSDWPEDASDDEIVAEAIENLKSAFTVIGLTEELVLSSHMLSSAFPWLNTTIEGSRTYCHLPHENSSPQNNHCIQHENTDPTKKAKFYTTHWDLPDHPDEETRKAIEAHNQLDLKLYEAAVQYFELQKRAFDANEAEV